MSVVTGSNSRLQIGVVTRFGHGFSSFLVLLANSTFILAWGWGWARKCFQSSRPKSGLEIPPTGFCLKGIEPLL
jgi:hypothetical protein